jgi:uncharacterized protein YfaS (alpha-2-macroglobulin family)
MKDRHISFFMIISILTLLLLAAGACSPATPPAPEQPEAVEADNETEVQVAETESEPAATPTPLPPIAPLVLSYLPETGQEQPVDAPLEITFDQPMDQDSVEKAFAIEPGASVDGIFDWSDDARTLRFTLDKGFERGQRYKVRVVETASSQAGRPLQRPFEMRFSAVGFLEVTNTQPGYDTAEILPDSSVTVMFNRPVVPLNAIEDAATLPDPLTFVPSVKGRGQWLNTSIYQFFPDDGFEPATQYTARVARGLTDANGNAELADDYEWIFTTVTPAVVASLPAADDVYVSPTPVISLAFNQPMDRDSVEQNLSLINQDNGRPVSGSFAWANAGITQPTGQDDFDGFYDYEYAEGAGPEVVGVETVAFTPDDELEPGTVYQVELPQGVKGGTGQAETNRDYSAAFTISPLPAIERTYPESGDTGVSPWQGLQVTFNTPMNPDTVIVGENLIIAPSVAVTEVYTYWWSSNTSLEINFPTEASSRYSVRLGADIESRYGQPLDETTQVLWETRAQSPMIYLHSPGRIATYNGYTDTLAFVSVRNVGQVNFGLYWLNDSEFIELNGNDWWETWEQFRPDENDLLAEWELPVAPELDDTLIYKVDVGEKSGLGNPLPPGLYYLEATVPPDEIYPEATGSDGVTSLLPERQMMVVSRNNLTFKTSNSEGLVWLTDLESGQPVSGVDIIYVTANDEGEAVTDRDGVALFDYAQEEDAYEPQFVFAGDPDAPDEDFAVAISNWSDGIERYSFDNLNVEDYQQPYNAHVYTDRRIYRPGQTIFFKGILRADDDARYSLPTAADTVQLRVSDSQGKDILTGELPLSQNGTLNGEIELDENAALGFYSIELNYDDDYYFYGDFQVAAYRAPEFLVTVETDQPEYVNGDSVKVTAAAEFFFGGPVSNAEVTWTLVSEDFTFSYAGDGFYDFTDYDTSRSSTFFTTFGETLAEGSGTTDSDGRFTFEVDADIADKLTSQRFTFDVVVTDLNNQVVASQANAVVHKGLFYVGLQPERYVGTVGQPSNVNVLVVDWDSQPVARQEVEVVFAEHNWYSVQRQYEDGSFYWDSYAETVPIYTTTVTSDGDGRAVASYTPENGGIYRVIARAVDNRRNTVSASTFMWVSGSEYVNWRQENNDRLDLVADKREYNVGDTATILVPHPYSGTVQALVTLERGHIYEHYVTELPTNSEQLEVEITGEMAPNMYLSVVVIKGVDEFSPLPSFKVGYASLPINTTEKELQITLTPNRSGDKTYQPGETAEYRVQVTDVQGEPIKAELSLAMVDKAVLSLAPETPGQLMSTFWRNRGLGVRTGGGLALAIDRINATVAPEAKGGGGGFDEGFGEIRGDFRDTALWLADFVTDENGEGTISADLPDNLTTWTMTGKGVTGADTMVGESRVDIVSTKPLLVRPVAPRFFVVNDQARLGVIVQNNSGDAQDVTVAFEGAGLEVGRWRIGDGAWEDSGQPALTVDTGERLKVEYEVTVQNVEQVELTMGAKSDEYGDALTIDLPVYRFSTPETVATVGILVEDGTRTEGIALPRSYDPSQGELEVHVDPSLAAGMRAGLDYLEHFRYECTEQTVSRFLPNVFTYRAYQELNLDNPELEEKLPGLVSTGLQRLYNQQHFDGGWGWWVRDDSDPFLTAYVLLGLVEAERAGFTVDENAKFNAIDYLEASLVAAKDIDIGWQANRQAFILYALAETGAGDLGRTVALFNERQKLDMFGRAYVAMALQIMDDEASQIEALLDDFTSTAITSATGAHWEEEQVDYFAMNTDTRSTAIIIAALSRIQPDHPLLPQAVRWLMSIRENGGHWETTQETAWALIGLTDFMIATGELDAEYRWRVSLNGDEWDTGEVDATNVDETTILRTEITELLADAVNRVAFERDPLDNAVAGSPGRLYYAAYLTYYKPVNEVKALDRGVSISRRYTLADDDSEQVITGAEVGDIIDVELTLIAPNDLHYVVVEDPFPAGTEGIDTSLATTSIVGEAPSIERTDRGDPWGYGWWWFSHSELRDEKAVLFATYLPKGTYIYRYQIRASLPGEFNVIPTHAAQMYFPEVFGRGDGGLFRIEQ